MTDTNAPNGGHEEKDAPVAPLTNSDEKEAEVAKTKPQAQVYEEPRDVDGDWEAFKTKTAESKKSPPCWFFVFIAPWGDAQQSKGLMNCCKRRTDDAGEELITDNETK
mmetsp:Transcript_34709/g.58325  ORF Transcript_34709/g.58325 Transcript_34709/m.58325 type:complete len:108 (+) Transcript_34709:403-726(+)|eukprot:CAMPEP_0198201310 /NCGR_PEP_ID=MMETSP1445-20131203/4035_1 /TAXON_ID=36898 /ORGANISM="Pyramimonas sp., Strain CCMP2087" /LENGTH=107 /DNA_ID=CAMNT_0043871539 /DNA_START=369 /DNA_END=692 /DNA_ORIENTATION=-